MSNHYDYMPKPEGWIPPVPESTADAAESPAAAADAADAPEAGRGAGSPAPSEPASPDGDSRRSSSDSSRDTIEYEDTTPAERALTRMANILSWIFVPLMMPVYGILLIFNLSILSLTSTSTKVFFTLTVFGANFVLPMLMVILLKKMGLINDIGLNGRRERLVPYIITMVCLLGTGWFLYFKGAPLWVAMFFAGGALAALINLIVNFRWKISAHAAGIAGIVAMLIQITKEGFPMPGMTIWIAASIIMAGLLGSARVWLGRHTLLQVLAGTAVGFLSVWSLSLL